MCLLFVAIAPRPDIQLALVANRDEFYARPTDAAQFRPDSPDLLAGWDRRGGGTWLGITRSGRLAALTNVRDPLRQRDQPPSRGALVRDYLLGTATAETFAQEALAQGSEMLGFNLICGTVGEAADLLCCCNTASDLQRLSPGLYGLSNAQLDTPWPKVLRGKAIIAGCLRSTPFGKPLLDALTHPMRDAQVAADTSLPDTGISKSRERTLSPMFIATADYGTRCTTVILVHADGRVLFRETTHAQGSSGPSRVEFAFVLTLDIARDRAQ